MSASTERVLRLMRGDERGIRASLTRGGLRALSLVYGAVIRGYWLMYRTGALKRVRLGPVVVSVGNMTVGGTGKTTTVQYLVRMLANAGLRSAVLSYGYRAASKDSVKVVSDGERVLLSASDAGDEAVLLARTLPGTPVLIGRRRVLSGAEAERRFQPDVLICDDAFQYWRLYRDIDLLLVDAVNPWGYGYVLPRGLLREPRSQAKRASAALITHADHAAPSAVAGLRNELERFGLAVWTSRHEPTGLTALDGVPAGPVDFLQDRAVLAVSSLGDPDSFEETLSRLGARVVSGRFVDHHRYTRDDVQYVEDRAEREALEIVTTAKDAVKIACWAKPERWRVLDIRLHIDDEASFHTWLLGTIRSARKNERSSG